MKKISILFAVLVSCLSLHSADEWQYSGIVTIGGVAEVGMNIIYPSLQVAEGTNKLFIQSVYEPLIIDEVQDDVSPDVIISFAQYVTNAGGILSLGPVIRDHADGTGWYGAELEPFVGYQLQVLNQTNLSIVYCSEGTRPFYGKIYQRRWREVSEATEE